MPRSGNVVDLAVCVVVVLGVVVVVDVAAVVPFCRWFLPWPFALAQAVDLADPRLLIRA